MNMKREFWPTPTVHGNYNRKGVSRKAGDGLETAVKEAAKAELAFIRWEITVTDEGYPLALATYGPYRLDVLDGASAVSWSIQNERGGYLDAGGGYVSMSLGMDEAEAALRQLLQEKKEAPLT